MDHDAQFKSLLQAFLPDFMRLAVPMWADRFDYRGVTWLDKEQFPDALRGRRREVDLLAQLKVREPIRASGATAAARQDRYLVLVHVEVDARRSMPDLRARMHAYGTHLQARFDLPLLPIALLLKVGLDGIGWDEHRVEVWGETTQVYRFRYVGLPALDALAALRSDNVLEVSLATLMKVPKAQRAFVAADALQRIAVARVNEMRTHLLVSTVDAYMNLDAAQQAEYAQILSRPSHKGARMIVTSWERKGHTKGMLDSLLLLGTQRFGKPTNTQRAQIDKLDPASLERAMQRLLSADDWNELLTDSKPKR